MKATLVYYVVMSMFLVAHISAMEIENALPDLPLDIIKIMGQKRDMSVTSHQMHTMLNGEMLGLPYTISPLFLKACWQDTPLDEDLRKFKDGEDVFPNIQNWDKTGYSDRTDTVRLSEDIRRTNDIYHIRPGVFESSFFDGVNDLNRALSAYRYDPDKPTARYNVYLWKQSKKFNQESEKKDYSYFFTGEGKLDSIMLEPDKNRFMCSVSKFGPEKQCTLSLYDIIKTDEGRYKAQEKAFSLLMNIAFKKVACLGNDTYLGITTTGDVYGIGLDKNNKLTLFEQKFSSSPHVFKDISVDRSVKTERSFKPRIALLTDKGEIYITDLCEIKVPTLLYVMTIENPHDVWRLYYHEGKLSIVYRNGRKNVFIYPDNFEYLFLSSLLKKLCS